MAAPVQGLPSGLSRAEEPRGIGGWLLLFALGQVLSVLVAGMGVPYLFSDAFAADWNAASNWPIYRMAIVSSGIDSLLTTAGTIVGLIFLFSVHRWTPRFYRGWLLTLSALGLVILTTSWFGFGEIIRDLSDPMIRGVRASEMRRHDLAMTGRGIAVALTWYLYWVKSKRVANTFIAERPPSGTSPDVGG